MIVNRFLEFENNNGFFEDEMDGFYYWPYIRYEVYTWIYSTSKKVKQQSHDHHKNKIAMLKEIARVLRLAVFHNTSKCGKHVDILAMGYPRWVKNSEGIFVDPYVEYLTKQLPYSTQVIERYSTNFKNYNSKTGSRIYTQDSELMVKFRTHFLPQKEKNIIEKKCQKIQNCIFEEFGIDIGIQSMQEKLTKSYAMWVTYQKKYRKLLTKTTPYCILETPGYADCNQVLNEIAKEFSIPTIEIEHGWMLESHVPYNYVYKGPIRSFPDHIMVCSQYQIDNVRFPIPLDYIHIVGSPFLEEQAKRTSPEKRNDKIILLLGNIDYIGDSINQFAIKLAQYIFDNKLDYKIIFKAHPKDQCQSETYKKLQTYSDIVEIVKGTLGKSVYDCLGEASIAIGTSTSTLYEAKAFGIMVYVLRAPDSESMRKFVEQGYAKYIDTPEEVFNSSDGSCKTNLWPKDALLNAVTLASCIVESEKSIQNEKNHCQTQ